MNVYDFDGTIYYPDCTVSFALWCANRHPKLWFTFAPKAVYRPNIANKEVYERNYQMFRRLYKSNAKHFKALNGI